MLKKEENIPPEIERFFKMFPGQTLLIKGKPGTGKTILSFEILKDICEEQNGLYLSTRVSPDKLHQLFPWIKNIVPAKNVVNATPGKILKALGTSSSLRSCPFDFGTALNFFKMLYEDAEDMDNPMVVIDSWDALLGYLKLEDEGASLAQSLCDFCREVGTHLIFVAETDNETPLDYIVDGVISTEMTNIPKEPWNRGIYDSELVTRTARQIELNKLRGVSIKQKNYIFTLEDGRFKYFPPMLRRPILHEIDAAPDIDGDHRSTGIKELDKITGGLEKGYLTLFEVGHGVGLRYVPFIEQIAMNLATKNVGVVRVRSVGAALTKGFESVPMMKGLYNFVPQTWLMWRLSQLFPTTKEYIDFLEATKKTSSEIMELSLMEARKVYTDFLEKVKKKHSEIAEFIGLDTFEVLYGVDNTLKLIDEAIARAAENKEILVGVVKRGMRSIEMITRLVNAHFVFKDLMGALFIYGVQPRTELYNVAFSEKGDLSLP